MKVTKDNLDYELKDTKKQDDSDIESNRMYMEMLMEECHIDISKEIKHPPIAIGFKTKEVVTKNGMQNFPNPIGTYGNFSFVQAPPKSMKTFFISLLVSAYINPKGLHTRGMISERGSRRLVHFDTEQGEWHAQRVFKRQQWMNKSSKLDFYDTFALRVLSPKDRVSLIEHYLESVSSNREEVGLVIIDGVADLISDVNNLEESSYVVQKIMTWTAKYNCHIVTVIHSNSGSDKPTGHLGSFLEKKAETQIILEKDENKLGCITAVCKRSRNTPFEPFDFKLDDSGLPIIVDLKDF